MQVVFVFGIIVPTLITVICFLGFLVCYFYFNRRLFVPTIASSTASNNSLSTNSAKRKWFSFIRQPRICDISVTSSLNSCRPVNAFSVTGNSGVLSFVRHGPRCNVPLVIIVDSNSCNRKQLTAAKNWRQQTATGSLRRPNVQLIGRHCQLSDVDDVPCPGCGRLHGSVLGRYLLADNNRPSLKIKHQTEFTSRREGVGSELGFVKHGKWSTDDIELDVVNQKNKVDNCYVDVGNVSHLVNNEPFNSPSNEHIASTSGINIQLELDKNSNGD